MTIEGETYPSMWLEVQFSNTIVLGINLHDHIDYELKRLIGGPMKTAEMRESLPYYQECHHITVIRRRRN